MKKIKPILLTLPVVSLLVLGLFTTYAYARDGSDDSSSTTNTSSGRSSLTNTSSGRSDSSGDTNNGDASSHDQTAEAKAKTEAESDSSQKTEIENEVEAEANDLVDTLRHDHGQHSTLDRQKNCQAAEHGLETSLTNLGNNAANFQARIDKVFSLALAYQSANNIQIANWDQLVAAAQTAKTKSASSVAALDALNVNLDCTSSTVAINVATFRVSDKKTLANLQAYKSAVQKILTALESAQGGNLQ